MFKYKIVVLFLIISINSLGQENYIDTLGMKQGQWLEFEAFPEIESISNIQLENNESKTVVNYNYKDLYILKFKGNYKDNLREKEWEVCTLEDKLRYLINYKRGVITGKFTIFYPNGNVMYDGIIENTKLTPVNYYTEKNEFIKTENWFTDELIKRFRR